MGHRSSMSNAMSSSSIIPPNGDPSHGRAMSMSNGGLNSGFTMPLKGHRSSTSSSTISGLPNNNGLPGNLGGSIGRGHGRSGSASSSWSRQGLGGGVLNFSMPTSSTAPRLATHSESTSVSRSSSASDNEPIVVMNAMLPRTGTKIPPVTTGGRRESHSAEKALREVEKALASVEAQG